MTGEIIDLREKQRCDNCELIPTTLTRHTADGLLPGMIRYLERKHGADILFFADGLGTEYNHSNVKGVNALEHRDIVFKISRLHRVK